MSQISYDISCTIAENLNNYYERETFIAASSLTSMVTTMGAHVYWNPENGIKVELVQHSADSVQAINNVSLKALAYQVVFESRITTDWVNRAMRICNAIESMLPNHIITVLVSEIASENIPICKVFGTTKGTAIYEDPEFRHRVEIVLT